MPISEEVFKEYLMIYGTTIEDWPEPLRMQAMRIKHRPAISALIIEQQFFDEVLLSNRHFEAASSNLAERIISAARITARSSGVTLSAWLNELLATVLPQPAFALATVLTLGIAIGLSLPAASADSEKDAFTQIYLDEDGVTL